MPINATLQDFCINKTSEHIDEACKKLLLLHAYLELFIYLFIIFYVLFTFIRDSQEICSK